MANLKMSRMLDDKGTVVSVWLKPATDAKEINGKHIAAQPEKYFVSVVCGDSFDNRTGFRNAIYLDYPVDMSGYQHYKYGDPVICTYEMNMSGEWSRCVPKMLKPDTSVKK